MLNGLAEPQSIALKRIHPAGIANGEMICRSLNSGKKLPSRLMLKSPCNQARTNSGEPLICRLATYSEPRYLLSFSLDGIYTRSRVIVSPVHGFVNVLSMI